MSKDRVTMIGWSGRWSNGQIGWRTSTFVASGASGLEDAQRAVTRCDFERVRITVEVVRRSDGRRIVKRTKP